MDITKFNDKVKALSLSIIDANEKGTKTVINSWEKFLGAESATYMHGLTKVAEEVSKNARKIVEDCSGFANAGHTK
jgi:hypothetical protein